jgi:hypothetical protein
VSWELDSSTVTDPTEADTCPGCGATHGVQPTPAPKVQAWTCTACGQHWATTAINQSCPLWVCCPHRSCGTVSLLAVLTDAACLCILAALGMR